ncbi:hypothetical protein WJX73_007271 [Symbiochloris irregularis]|uniref:Fungal lipase-type domain-containing protein n=1 Tax=Symbiochloris irregularis TaxID=706552 RepID=A0AAW1P0M0_9CHLO
MERKQVVLRVELVTGLEAKIRNLVTSGIITLAWIVVILLTIWKSILQDKAPDSLISSPVYVITLVCFSSVFWVPLCTRILIFSRRVIATVREGHFWAPRRKRMATLAFAAGITQLINCSCWIAPHALFLSGIHKTPHRCHYFSPAVDALAVVRWTCWNTTFLIWWIMGHSLEAWAPNAKSRSVFKAGVDPAVVLHGKMVLDTPWSYHRYKLILWVLYEVFVILLVVPIFAPTSPPIVTPGHADDCTKWDYVARCANSRVTNWPAIPMAVLQGVYAHFYTVKIIIVHRQLRMRLMRDMRAAKVLWRVQAEGILIAFQALWFSFNILWFNNSGSCWSYITSWPGLFPLQLIGVGVAWDQLWLFMPKSPNEDPIIQAWLQEYAWTEVDQAQQTASRNARANTEQEEAALSKQPLFCFETALKLHVFSCLAYTEVGQKGSEGGEEWWKGMSWREKSQSLDGSGQGLVRGQMHASLPSELCSEDILGMAEGPEEADWAAEPTGSQKVDQDGLPSTSKPAPRVSTDSRASEATSNEEVLTRGLLREGETDYDMLPSTSEAMPEGMDDARHSYEFSSNWDGSEADVEAGHLGRAARAYRRHQWHRQRAQRLLRTAMGVYGLKDLRTFWDEQRDTKALLAWNHSTVVIAFRGTQSIRNAWSDLQVWRTPHPPMRGRQWLGTCPMVHTGFYGAWTSKGLDAQVLKHLQGLVDDGAIQPDACVRITGHSLGGALALLAAFDIAKAHPAFRMQVVTFGCPYPGNYAFCREYDALIPNTWHVINKRDPVPRAGKFVCLFKRPGHRVLINLKGELVVRPNALELQLQRSTRLDHHTTFAYRAALLSICLAQFSSCGLPGGAAGILGLSKSAYLCEDLQRDGLDFHRLRRISRWGMVGSSRLAPPTPAELRKLMMSRQPHAASGGTSGCGAWKPRAATSPWIREPRVTQKALETYRESLQEGEDEEETAKGKL